jgi:large subunit ribosomal protein L10
MPLSRQQKEQLLESYTQGMAAAPHAFLLSFEKISVPQVTELRSRVRASGGDYVVVKNTIALRAVEGAALGGLADRFQGPTAVAYCSEDAIGLAKALTDFAQDIPGFQFKGGLVDGRQVSAEEITEIARMPSREELLARLLYLLQSPATRLVRTLAAVPRDLVVVLNQIGAKKENDGAS